MLIDSNNMSFEEKFAVGGMPNRSEADVPKQMLTMRDQDQIVQELKKENFDLKLRLYMQTKNSESNQGKVSEYEQQLGAILNRFEEQQKFFDQQARQLAEAKHKEKMLLKRQRNLEAECKLRDEKIQNLNISLSKLSTSMSNLSSPRHYTPSRNTQSMYFAGPDSEEEGDDEDGYNSGITSHSAQVSRVAPMRRQNDSTSYNDEMRLVDNERQSRNSFESTHSDPTSHITKNYYSTTINNPQDLTDGFDNIGIVKPNNSRTVIDVEIPESYSETPMQQQRKKKKRKGLLSVFKLCSGKSGQTPSREESMYHKRPSQQMARVTMQTYSTGYNNE